MNILFGPIIYTSSQIKLKRSHPSREDYICNDVCHWLGPFLRDQRQWIGNAQQDVQYIPLSDQNTIELCYLCKRLALNNLNIMTSLQIQTSCPNSNDPRKVSNIPKQYDIPDSKVHGANMGPTWVLSAPDGPHVGPMNLAIRDVYQAIQPNHTQTSTDLQIFCFVYTQYVSIHMIYKVIHWI